MGTFVLDVVLFVGREVELVFAVQGLVELLEQIVAVVLLFLIHSYYIIMKHVKGFFKNLDFFSVPFSPAITDDEEFYHKSIIGGFCSIAVLFLSGAYAVYMFILWQNL